MNNNKVTYIEELFDLDDRSPQSDQQSMQGYPPRISQNFDKQMMAEQSERDVSAKPMQSKIRKHLDPRIAMNGGVTPSYNNNNNGDYFLIERGNFPPQRPPQRPQFQIPRQNDDDEREFEMGPRVIQNIPNIQNIPHHPLQPRELSCMEIARHVKHCPICSKFYDNDKSVYIIVIILLVIFCIILLKKILDMSMTRNS
jgi:hypothetical protein